MKARTQEGAMVTFAEEIMLLVLDDESGKLLHVDLTALNYAMAGAVLMDLALREKIDTDVEHLMLTDRTPTGEPILDRYLDEIATNEAIDTTQVWVSRLAQDGPRIQEEALERLVG